MKRQLITDKKLMKMKNIIKKRLSIWLVGVLISIYIIVSSIFPEIRIPYNIRNEVTTEVFDGIMTSLAISYITGLLVYGLTVVHKRHKERTKRRWELDALVTEFNNTLVPLEKTIDGLDNAKLGDCDDDTFDTFKKNLSKTLDSVHFCKDIMNEEEYEKISDIRRALSVLINPPSMMDDDEAERCLQALRDIRTDIDDITASIYHLMKWNCMNNKK